MNDWRFDHLVKCFQREIDRRTLLRGLILGTLVGLPRRDATAAPKDKPPKDKKPKDKKCPSSCTSGGGRCCSFDGSCAAAGTCCPNEFRCGDGSCVLLDQCCPEDRRCANGDCIPDGSEACCDEERNCRGSCAAAGQCCPDESRCDDGTCLSSGGCCPEFRCADGSCVAPGVCCSGERSCPNGPCVSEDQCCPGETVCGVCRVCDNGACVRAGNGSDCTIDAGDAGKCCDGSCRVPTCGQGETYNPITCACESGPCGRGVLCGEGCCPDEPGFHCQGNGVCCTESRPDDPLFCTCASDYTPCSGQCCFTGCCGGRCCP
jgi:hypothetical protein